MKKTPITKWFKPNFSMDDSFKKPSNDHSTGIPVKSKLNKGSDIKETLFSFKDASNANLLEKVAPKSVSDLGVHAKKVQEVEEWLTYNVVHSEKVSVLLVTGPTGAGKTATVQVLCNTMNIKIIEWVNAVEIDIEEFRGPGQTTRFTEFLIQSSRYPSLLINSNKPKKQVILVEDFPNSIVYNPAEFANILELLYNKGKYSAIFICTETKDNSSNLGQQLFPDTIKNKFGVATISFNPVSVTLLKTALKRVNTMIKEQYSNEYQCPGQDSIETIVNSSMGDIRSAVNYFNFACLKGSANLPATIQLAQQSGSKRKRKEKDKGTLTNMSRDESLGLLHGVGRVLYPKRIEHQPFWKFERQPETIVDQFGSMPTLFTSFLHENYLKYFGDFNDVTQATEILSFAELLLADWKDDFVTKYGLWVAIMGLMVANKNSVSKWNPVQGPKHLKYKYVDQLYENNKVNSIDVGYYNVIKPPGFISNGHRFLPK